MNEQTHPSRRGSLGWVQNLSILVLGVAAGAALIYSLQPAKPKPTQVLYSICVIQSEAPIADFRNEARAILAWGRPAMPLNSTWSMQGSMTTSANLGATAKVSLQPPDSSNGAMQSEQLTFDLTSSVASNGVRTKFGVLKGVVRSEHQFELDMSDLRVIELSKGNAPFHGYYYALVHVVALAPRTESAALGRARTMAIPSQGTSK